MCMFLSICICVWTCTRVCLRWSDGLLPRRHPHILPLLQDDTSGSVSGGGDPINPDTDAKLSLLRTGTANNLQTSTEFFLSATFTQGLTTPAGIIVTGDKRGRLTTCNKTS